MLPLQENFQILRVTVESQTAFPSVVAVTAATPGDGTTYVACGLARAFAEAGHSTLLVDANVERSGIADELGVRGFSSNGSGFGARASDIPGLSVVALPTTRPHNGSPLRDMLDAMRSHHEITIVDTAPALASGAALDLARSADSVLLAVRMGRRALRADRDLRDMLGEFGSHVIGVVPTHAQGRPRVRALVPRTIPTLDAVPKFARANVEAAG